MNRRIVFIAGGGILLTLIIVSLVLLSGRKSSLPFDAVPQNAAFLLEIPKISDYNDAEEQPSWKALQEIPPFAALDSAVALFMHVTSSDPQLKNDAAAQPVLSAGFTIRTTQLNYLFLMQLDDAKHIDPAELKIQVDGESPEISVHRYEKENITEFAFPKQHLTLACTKVYGVFMFSTSSVLVENAVLQIKKENSILADPGFSKVYSSSEEEKGLQVYFQLKQFANYISMFAANENDVYSSIMSLQKFASWMKLGISFFPQGILLSGYASTNPESNMTLDRFAGAPAENYNHSDIIPSNSFFLQEVNNKRLAESISSRITDEEERARFIDRWSSWMSNYFVSGISETYNRDLAGKSYLIIAAADTAEALRKLQPITENGTLFYNTAQIRKLKENMFPPILPLQVQKDSSVYYSIIAGYVFFTSSSREIKTLIDAYANDHTLSGEEDYRSFSQNLPSGFTTSVYIDFSKTDQLIKAFGSEKEITSLADHLPVLHKFSPLCLRFTADKDAYIVGGFLQFSESVKRKTGSVWKTQLDASIALGPFTITNTSSGQKHILVQDSLMQLYLLSAAGDIVWKQQLSGFITGNISEVDFYRTQQYQMAFALPDGIYVLDVNGNPVEGFPIHLTSAATNPLTIIDENNDGDYEMFIACSNGNVYGFSKDGRPLSGWNPCKNTGTVTTPLSFLVTDKNDYIIFANTNGDIFAKSEKGENRFKVRYNDGISFPFTPIPSENKFLSLDESGNIFSVNTNGDLKTTHVSSAFRDGKITDIDNDGISDIFYTDGRFYFAEKENQSVLFKHSLPDSSSSCMTAVSKYNGRNYAALVCSGKIWLVDSKGEAEPEFPVAGSEHFLITEPGGNGDKMLITAADKFVFAYRIR